MNFEELLDYLDLEEAGQFEYFEALADLVECEEPIEMEAIYKLFEGADKETVATLLEGCYVYCAPFFWRPPTPHVLAALRPP